MGLGPLRFYVNNHAADGNHWIGLNAIGDGTSPNVIGAKVIINAGGQAQMREIGLGATGWASQSPTTQLVGLGDAAEAEVTICWPDGFEEHFGKLGADRYHTLNRGTGNPSGIECWMLITH